VWSCVCRCLENISAPIHYICHIAFQPSITRTLLNQEFPVVKLKSSLWKFYDRLHDLVNRYGISMSKITTVSCVFRNHKPILSQFMTYHPICNKSNTAGTASGTGTAYPSGAPEFTLVFSWVHVAQSLVSLVFCVEFCRSLFVLFCLAIVLSVLPFTACEYPFCIFKLFLNYLLMLCELQTT